MNHVGKGALQAALKTLTTRSEQDQTVSSCDTAPFPTTANCVKHGDWQMAEIIDGAPHYMNSQGCPGCVRDQRLGACMAKARIPPRYRGKTIGSYVTNAERDKTAAKDVAKIYAETFDEGMPLGRSLILAGTPGTGKTHLGCGIAQAVMPKHSVLFASAGHVIRTVRAAWRSDNHTNESDVLSNFASYDLLIIDDVGVQYGTESEQLIIHEVINHCYEQMRPMILISNLNLEGLKKHIGERAYDRLRENGGRLVVFSWRSYRGGAK